MRVLVSRTVIRRIVQEADYYRRYTNEEVASRIVRSLRDAVNSLKQRQRGHKVDGLPTEYRRVNVKPFYFCYLEEEGVAYVYLLRGQRQKPLRLQDHKALATKAKRDSIELN